MADRPIPAVDAAYWFTFSKAFVDSAIARRDSAAGTLQKLVLWLWGVYTASAAVGFALSAKELSLGTTILIASASVVLILLYWVTVWIQLPSLVEFDPRSPEEIRDAHNHLVLMQSRKLGLATVLSLVAAAMVSVALLAASTAKAPRRQSLTALATVDESCTRVALSAVVPDVQAVDIAVEATVGGSGRVQDRAIPVDGVARASAELGQGVQQARVRVAWTDASGLTHQLSRLVSVATPAVAAGGGTGSQL